ncbi:dimethylarginine dimethylaminohydrolase family protein [Pseudoxanthomonas sacheonensis]|uniref:dimethylarginine dimethylaminohydrolase family protein n=1 Tax=Pseudoxanthomonas sacheonensis TaxID=443615 RepID=UPI0013D5D3B6|nr:arginine deiminase-related protein [Pseudoxanthomonas sacheonensis]KAF1707829.1 nitrate reductase [Pseudoxanthomonas sacheonensis]
MPSNPRLLMCPPTHFAVDYVINPWMEGNLHSADPARAQSQWAALHETLSDLARIDLVAPGEGLPDMPFTANAGLVLDDVFVPSRFHHAQRRGEEALFTDWFAQQGFTIRHLPVGMDFEGAGDALLDRGAPRLWLGHGHRSDAGVAQEVAAMFDLEAIPLRLSDPRFYHLDTCFCPLTGGWLLYYPPAFDAEAIGAIAARIPESRRIAVSEQDALAFACNAVNIGTTVVVNRASSALKTALGDAGFEVIETPLGEFLKTGGSAKCLTLRLDEP